ncbi:MAG TPA: thiol reductase thioredoxin [candidate division Zixibacteria bacterium]|nr:thiol reductase thioredoxin [candidate division Zixibacteria bacterium]
MGFLNKLFNREPKPGKPQELGDADFDQKVLASDTPAVVDFWSSRCAPCQVMSGLLNELGPDYAGKINIFKLNVDYNAQAAAQYQVRSVPTLVLFKNHRPVERIVGLVQLNPLKEKLDKLVE